MRSYSWTSTVRYSYQYWSELWWRHQMETFSASLAIRAVPAQRPVTRSFDIFFDLRLNKPLSKQPWGWWFETLSHPLWRHCNGTDMLWYICDIRVKKSYLWNKHFDFLWRKNSKLIDLNTWYMGCDCKSTNPFKSIITVKSKESKWWKFMFINVSVYHCYLSKFIFPFNLMYEFFLLQTSKTLFSTHIFILLNFALFFKLITKLVVTVSHNIFCFCYFFVQIVLCNDYKIWWLCLVPTSTIRFASDVGYRMAKNV